MMAKFAELLAGFIVEKFCAKMGLKTPADLEALVGRIVKAELPDLSKFETMPDQIIANVNGQIGAVVAPLLAIPAQVLAGFKNLIPGLPNIFGR